MNFVVPDLRFEESFVKKIDAYRVQPGMPVWRQHVLTAYAVAKELVIMPFLQGLLWLGILILSRPFMASLAIHGRSTALKLKAALTLAGT